MAFALCARAYHHLGARPASRAGFSPRARSLSSSSGARLPLPTPRRPRTALLPPLSAVPPQRGCGSTSSSSGGRCAMTLSAAGPAEMAMALAAAALQRPSALAARIAVGLAVNGALWAALSAPAARRRQRVLTDAGVRHGAFLGALLWGCGGAPAWGLCVLFLGVGSLATRAGRARKEARGIAQDRGGARGPANLWGAAGAAALCALALLAADAGLPSPWPAAATRSLARVAYVAALAAKMSDTCASEVGKAYGRATFLVTSGRRVPRGTEGAVSAEGTAAGVAASLLAAGYAYAVGLLGSGGSGGGGGGSSSIAVVVVVVVAAFVANLAESVIGATVQEKRGWSNEFVNFLNTSIGALVAAGIVLATRCCGW